MEKGTKMIGYKGFDRKDGDYLICRDFKYKIGETYELKGKLELCKNGFHFCENVLDVFDYKDRECPIALVEALGQTVGDKHKSATDKIRIIRLLDRSDPADGINSGYGNSGNGNSGDRNSGNGNSGNGNSGDRNSGYGNSGDGNSGDRNSGYGNSGDRNSGYGNSGNGNSGNRNSGYGNSGDRNSGYGNSGDRNSGDFNAGNYNSGFFNTVTPKATFFNRPSDLTVNDALSLPGISVMRNMPQNEYIENKTDADCKKYLIVWHLREATSDDRQAWWDKLPERDKNSVRALPNYDRDIFYACTGIKDKENHNDPNA